MPPWSGICRISSARRWQSGRATRTGSMSARIVACLAGRTARAPICDQRTAEARPRGAGLQAATEGRSGLEAIVGEPGARGGRSLQPVSWFGPAEVKREPLPQSAPRALSEEQQRALLRGAEASRPRDQAMVTLLLYTALRLHELVDLDVGDVSISARKRPAGGPFGEGRRLPGGAAEPSVPRTAGGLAEAARGDTERLVGVVRWSPGPAAHATLCGPRDSRGCRPRRSGALCACPAAYVRDQPGARRQRHRAGRGAGGAPAA